jgi:hypothetical protein
MRASHGGHGGASTGEISKVNPILARHRSLSTLKALK